MPGSRTGNPILITLLACATLCGCGDSGKDTTAPPPPATGIVTPTQPPVESRSPAVVPEVESPPTTPPEPTLNPELHTRFTRGLTLAEAQALTSIEPIRVGGDGKVTEIYRWTDELGASFTTRFDAGVLTTKSNLRATHAPGEPTPAPSAGLDLDNMPVAQIAPGVYIPLERAVTSATEQPLGASELPEAPASQASQPAAPSVDTAPDGPTIAIAGAARRSRTEREKASSYNPKASLPDFSRSLEEGSFEIRFLNPSDSPMSAGLRQDQLGKDVAIPPKGKASIKVNRGIYQLYFLRESEPDTLFEAPIITIDGFQATDVEVHLDPENVEVRLIDYSKPGS
jgi:hypothetical protein